MSTLRSDNYLFSIADHNIVNILRPLELGQIFLNPIMIIDVQKAPLWPSKQS